MSETQSTKDSGTVYEIGFHIAPIVGDEKLAYEVSEIKGLLEKIKAETISEDFTRLKVLAYPLSKVISGSKKTFKEAYFGWIKFEADAEAVTEFKNEVEKLSNVLRFLIIKTVKENTLYGNKFAPKYEGKPKKEEEKKAEEPKGPINEAEIDKTIEDLVIE